MSRQHPTTIRNLLVRRVQLGERWLYAAIDVVRLLAETEAFEEYWEDLKQREPRLARLSTEVDIPGPGGTEEMLEMLDLPGVLRVIQAIPTQRAERLKRWMAEVGRQRLDEMENPELAMLRAARLYQMRGHGQQWIGKRLRGVSARHELTREWRRRGVIESDQYRQLTNDLMRSAFGMDVNEYRRFKSLTRPTENLRDHMNDLELVLTMLAETTAAELHRDHNSLGLDQLDQDVKTAGEIAAHTRQAIERQSSRAVVDPGRFGAPPAPVEVLPAMQTAEVEPAAACVAPGRTAAHPGQDAPGPAKPLQQGRTRNRPADARTQ